MSNQDTAHQSSPHELGHAASDGEQHHPGDLVAEAHGPDDHGETHGHDDHAHGADVLGPVDVWAWGALAIGVAAGLLVALCLLITTTLLAVPATI